MKKEKQITYVGENFVLKKYTINGNHVTEKHYSNKVVSAVVNEKECFVINGVCFKQNMN